MITAATVMERARSATGQAIPILYWIGEGGKDPGAASPSSQLHVAAKWAEQDAATQQELAPLAQAMGIDVHDPALWRPACDCSGYVCWALGIPRSTPGPHGSQDWTNTDSIWADARGPQQRFEHITKARAGALVVYPKLDSGENYGHIAIVMAVDADGEATLIAHCSADNIKAVPHDSIKITGPEKFKAQNKSIYAWCRDVA